MSTLIQQTPRNEYLHGVLHKLDKDTGEITAKIPFKYRNYTLDKMEEQQLQAGLQFKRVFNMIYTSSPITITNSDRMELEDQVSERKVKIVDFDRSKNTDLRLSGIKNKNLYLGKIVTLE